jgi:hypothetical protein
MMMIIIIIIMFITKHNKYWTVINRSLVYTNNFTPPPANRLALGLNQPPVPRPCHSWPGFAPCQSMCDLWQTVQHWNRFYRVLRFSPVSSITPATNGPIVHPPDDIRAWKSYIIWGVNNRYTGGRSSETWSDPITWTTATTTRYLMHVGVKLPQNEPRV